MNSVQNEQGSEINTQAVQGKNINDIQDSYSTCIKQTYITVSSTPQIIIKDNTGLHNRRNRQDNV